MTLDEIGIEEAVAGVRQELAALRVTLEAIEGTRGEVRRRSNAFEEEILTRLATLEGRMTRLETQTAEAQQFVKKLRNLRLLRARRRILQRLHD